MVAKKRRKGGKRRRKSSVTVTSLKRSLTGVDSRLKKVENKLGRKRRAKRLSEEALLHKYG